MRVEIFICMMDSLYCTPKTNKIVWVNYTPIKWILKKYGKSSQSENIQSIKSSFE